MVVDEPLFYREGVVKHAPSWVLRAVANASAGCGRAGQRVLRIESSSKERPGKGRHVFPFLFKRLS